MKALTNTLARLEPPRWLMFMLAAVLGAALLVAFVATLQEGLRHGEEFRQGQRVSSVRQAISTVADATTRVRQPQLP